MNPIEAQIRANGIETPATVKATIKELIRGLSNAYPQATATKRPTPNNLSSLKVSEFLSLILDTLLKQAPSSPQGQSVRIKSTRLFLPCETVLPFWGLWSFG